MNTCECGNPANAFSTACLRCSALYELGLKSGATDAEIKSAYRLYVKAWHPDRFPGDEQSKNAAQEKLKKINFAYSYLKYLTGSVQDYTSNPVATKNSQEPAHRSQTPEGQTPRAKTEPAHQPPPRSKSSGATSPKTTLLGTLFSKLSVARRWGYLFYLIPLILWLVGEFNTIPSNRGRSSPTSTEAISPAAPPQNNAGGGAVRLPSGLTPVPVDQNDIESTPAIRLLNGTELRKRRRLNGLGELTIENGTSFDAVVHLIDLKTEKTIRTF